MTHIPAYDDLIESIDARAASLGREGSGLVEHDGERRGLANLVVHFATSGALQALNAAWSGYLSAWMFYAFLGIGIGFVTNGIFHIDLYQAVDVCLSLFLFLVGLQVVVQLLSLVEEFDDYGFEVVVYSISRCLLWFLLPFAIVAGFMLYGFAASEAWTSKSFVYTGYIGVFVGAYEVLAGGWFGDFLGAISETKSPQGASQQVVDIDLVTKYLYALSLVVTILVQLISWRRSRESN